MNRNSTRPIVLEPGGNQVVAHEGSYTDAVYVEPGKFLRMVTSPKAGSGATVCHPPSR